MADDSTDAAVDVVDVDAVGVAEIAAPDAPDSVAPELPPTADAPVDVPAPAKLPPMPQPNHSVGLQMQIGGGVADRLAGGLRPAAGGLAVVGATQDAGAGAMEGFAVRLDPCGGVVWARTFGGDHDEGLTAVAEAPDDGMLLAGHTASNGGSDDVLLVRTDALGKALWSRTYGGLDDDAAVAIAGGPQGWTVLATTRSFGGGAPQQVNPLLMRVAADASLLWARVWWLTAPTVPAGLAAASDGGVLAVGQTEVKGHQQDVWLARVSQDGVLQWATTFGGPLEDRATAASQTEDHGFLIAGMTRNFGAVQGDLLVLRTDAAGKALWARRAGTQGFDEARALWPVPQGFLLAGTTAGAGAGQEDFALTGWTDQGNPQWMRTFGTGSHELVASAGPGGTEGIWLIGWQTTLTGGSAGWLVQVEAPDTTQCGSNSTPVTPGWFEAVPSSAWQPVMPYETSVPALEVRPFAMQTTALTEFTTPGCTTVCP